ncbi:MAG: hypothetical protein JNM18_25260 [Planctomycetaceae bacterium]|nr:hypothetical protein [Planctomycetaceae bacterium]
MRPLRTIVACLLLGVVTASVVACPFCSPPGPTVAEEIQDATAVVIGKYMGKAPASNPDEPALDRFEIVRTLKGAAALADRKHVDTLLLGEHAVGTRFFIVGNEDDGLAWAQPIALSEQGEKFVTHLVSLPASGAERLRFFLPYLSETETFLRDDAYDEFAKAPYADVKVLKPHLQREALVAAIGRRDVEVRYRRLFLTLLGICGTEAETPLLETWIRERDPDVRQSLDAIVACYLTLRGAEGLPFIEQTILSRADAEFNDLYSAAQALRFHGEEERRIDRTRLSQSLRLLLQQPRSAELVIPDLARWQDWSALDDVARLFSMPTDKPRSLRVLIVQYLHACPLPAAKTKLAEFTQLDPETVQLGSSPFATARRLPKREAETD